MRKPQLFIRAIVALPLILTLLGSTFVAASAGNQQLNADPRLLQLAADHPDDGFQVIVQKDARQKHAADDGTEAAVEQGGGQVNRGKKMEFIASFAATLTGKEIEKLARHPGVRWISFDAPAFLAGGFGSNTYRDEFNSLLSYSGSNGTSNWGSNAWAEVGEADGPRWGDVIVSFSSACPSGYCLRIGSGTLNGVGIYRKARLGSATSATLTFSSRLLVSAPSSGKVSLQVSTDGVTWTTLDTFLFTASDSAAVAKSYDISPFAWSNTLVRFLGDGTVSGYLYVDNFQIEYTNLANSYIRTTHTSSVWASNATPGAGVTVAVVDSGITDRTDLYTGSASRIVASVDFSSNRNPAAPVGYDDYGHGTHVAGIIGGAGQASQGARLGNAPPST